MSDGVLNNLFRSQEQYLKDRGKSHKQNKDWLIDQCIFIGFLAKFWKNER